MNRSGRENAAARHGLRRSVSGPTTRSDRPARPGLADGPSPTERSSTYYYVLRTRLIINQRIEQSIRTI
jgi:hypothetical protein